MEERINSYSKIILLIILFLLPINFSLADSPLTSIEFWRVSKNNYALEIGEKEGKQMLDKRMFEFLMDPLIDSFDKYSLINSLGWEFNSKVNNSLIFLNYFKSSLKKESKHKLDLNDIKSNLLNLGDDYFVFYEYLKAMDNYLNVKDIRNEIISNVIIQKNDIIEFIFNLIDYQTLFIDSEFCAVYESYQSYLLDTGINNKELFYILNNYLLYYSKYCDKNYIYLENKKKSYILNINKDIYIINYPIFVYGKMEVLRKRKLILEKYCDGDDFFIIEKGLLNKGKYNILLTEDDNKNIHQISLRIVD